MSHSRIAFLICLIAGFTGCDSSSAPSNSAQKKSDEKKASALIGTWEGSDPALKDITLVFVFTGDGKFTRETVIKGMPKDAKVTVDGGKQEGTYKHEDKTVTFTSKGEDKKMTVKELSDSKLVLANQEGKEMTFAKKN